MPKHKRKNSKEKKVKAQKRKSPKKKQVKDKFLKEKMSDPRIEDVYEKEITFNCPVRGLVTQKVKVKRYRPLGEQTQRPQIGTSDELVNKLEEKDSGLSIYNDGEELGIVDGSGENE